MKRFLIIVALSSLSAPALASQNTCYLLWEERNDLYAQARYCFKTQLAIDRFGNQDCKYSNINDVPLSLNNRKTIQDIVETENRLHCIK